MIMMEKSTGLFFASLMLLSVLSVFVSAQGDANTLGSLKSPFEGPAQFFDPVKNMFADWESGNLSVNIAKYLIWLIAVLFVYSVLKVIPVLKDKLNGFVHFLLALVIGFLGSAYLTPSDIYTILTGYSALSFVLSALLPMLIIAFFSMEVAKGHNSGGRMIAKVIWFVFILFLVFKLVDGMFGITSGGVELISKWQGWLYVAVIVFSILWILKFESVFLKSLFKTELKDMSDLNLKDNLSRLTADIDERDVIQSKSVFLGEQLDEWVKKTDSMRKERKALQKKLGK